jgi:hypothetical protein
LGRHLAKQMCKKRRILIDMCHWIKMRDSERGKSIQDEYREISQESSLACGVPTLRVPNNTRTVSGATNTIGRCHSTAYSAIDGGA